VSKLEQELFGQTYSDETLSERLTQLEDKAFGSPSNSSDMSKRIEYLESYADRHDLFGENTASAPGSIVPFSPEATSPNSSAPQPYSTAQTPPAPTATATPFVGSAPALVAMMESQMFDHTYPSRPLMERVRKLERCVFNGNVNTNASLNARVAKLWDTLHPTEPAQVQSLQANTQLGANGNNTYTSNNGQHYSWLHGLAKGIGVVAGGLARGMMYSGMGGYGYGMGMGSYGMGYGYGSYGMGYPYGMMGGYGGYPLGYGMYRPFGY
jgi:hypothetical protein